MKAVLRLRGIGYDYGGAPALAGIDLDLGPGEITAIMGPSGCGKTTLLRLAAGFLAPQRGTVERSVPAGMAFQEPRLLPWRNSLQNVLFGLERPGEEAVARAGRLLAALGLSGYERVLPQALSGGMAQRVSLARALINEPQLLLLDEPLNGMDYFGRLDLEDRLAAHWLQTQPSVLLVTHDLDEALYLADKIVVLSARPGRVLAELRVNLTRPRARADAGMDALRRELAAALSATKTYGVENNEI